MRSPRRIGLAAVVGLLAAVAPARAAALPSVNADSVRLEALTRQVAAQLRCVVCQGLSIQDSPSELAQSMKSVVREQLAAGATPEDVKAYFVGRYGEWVLMQPPARGFNLTVYVLPVFATLGGFALLIVAARRWSRGAPPAGGGAIAPDDPDLAPWEEIRAGR
jgi:cytochrome c-type biogenesis protein CcmH